MPIAGKDSKLKAVIVVSQSWNYLKPVRNSEWEGATNNTKGAKVIEFQAFLHIFFVIFVLFVVNSLV